MVVAVVSLRRGRRRLVGGNLDRRSAGRLSSGSRRGVVGVGPDGHDISRVDDVDLGHDFALVVRNSESTGRQGEDDGGTHVAVKLDWFVEWI